MAELTVITLDASDLEKILASIGARAKSVSRAVLQQRLSYRANQLAKRLNTAAPQRKDGREDTRYKYPLSESFYVDRQSDSRVVRTLEPQKLALVTQGTVPHYIFPRHKKALFWPGLLHPVTWVGPPYTALHPGTKANDFVTKVLNTSGIEQDGQEIADLIAVGITTRVYHIGE